MVGPFLKDIPHRDRSLSFWHYNTSKRGITLNLDTSEGKDLFRRLVPSTDILLETEAPGYLPSLGLGYEALACLNSRLIRCSLTPFGQTGPWRDYQTSDLLHLAAGGQSRSRRPCLQPPMPLQRYCRAEVVTASPTWPFPADVA